MKREYHKWYSPSLKRDMELLVYGHAGARVLLFPTRTARFYDYEDWRIIQSIEHLINDGKIQVFSLDSIDQESFYCFWAQPQGRIERHLQYEQYIINEVIPLTQLVNNNPDLWSVGCSMGAYHAMNIAFRYPKLFKRVISLSGRYDLTLKLGMFDDLMSGVRTDDVYYLMPSYYMPNLPEGEQLETIRHLDILFVIGKKDAFIENNRSFSKTLWEKGIWHAYHEWDGLAHRAKFWRQMLPMYM